MEKFEYLDKELKKKGLTMSKAAKQIGKDASTIRNWVNGTYIDGAFQGKTKAQRDIVSSIAQLLGVQEAKVLEEIKKYLIKTGKLNISQNNVFDELNKIIEKIKKGDIYCAGPCLMNDSVKKIALNDLETLKKNLYILCNSNSR